MREQNENVKHGLEEEEKCRRVCEKAMKGEEVITIPTAIEFLSAEGV